MGEPDIFLSLGRAPFPGRMLLEIGAGTKCLLLDSVPFENRAGEDQTTDPVFGACTGKDVLNLEVHLLDHRVHAFGPVELDRGQRFVDEKLNRLVAHLYLRHERVRHSAPVCLSGTQARIIYEPFHRDVQQSVADRNRCGDSATRSGTKQLPSQAPIHQRLKYFLETGVLISNAMVSERELQSAGNAKEFESEVAKATRELEEKNRELRRLNEELYYIQRRLARMERLSAAQHVAARFAHKIGTPLNLISGHIQVLLQGRKEDEPLSEKLQLIQSQIGKLETIVREIMDETRKTDSRARVLRFDPTARPDLRARGAHLRRPGDSGRQEVRQPIRSRFSGTRHNSSKCFSISSTTALDAMPEGGTLTVRTEPSEEGVRVELVDSGEGMTESALSQMFRPFFTTKEMGRGTGLGLSIVKEILSAHGATIDAESELGQGTTFKLVFPVGNRRYGGIRK